MGRYYSSRRKFIDNQKDNGETYIIVQIEDKQKTYKSLTKLHVFL